MRLTRVDKWWDRVGRYSCHKRLGVPDLPYEKLTQEQQKVVYSYFSGGEEWEKHKPRR